ISGMVLGTSYTVTADNGSCTSLASASFSNAAMLAAPAVPTLASTAATCAADGSSSISNYSASNTYTFTPAGPSVDATGAISGMVLGTSYTVTADNGSCTSLASASFSNAAMLAAPAVPTLASTAATCAADGSSSISNYSASNTYTFTPAGPSVDATGAISGMVLGTSYTVTADNGNCTSLASASFSNAAMLAAPAVPTLASTAATCAADGSSSISNYSASNTYTFTPAGPSVDATGAISGMVLGTSYTVTADNGSCTSLASASFSNAAMLAAPAVPTLASTAATCAADCSSSISNYSASNTYTFTPAGPTVDATGAISGMVLGTSYTVTADNGSCTSVASASFSNAAMLAAPAVLFTKTNDATCSSGNDGKAALTITGGSSPTISWIKDGATIAAPNLNALKAGVYQVTVSNACGSIIRSITINTINRAPLASNDNFTGQSGVIVNGSVATNDSDPDGDALTYTVQASTNSGTLVMQQNGSFAYTPAAGFNGTVVYNYTVSDPCGSVATASLTIVINSPTVNRPPVAVNDNYSTSEGVALIIQAPGIMVNDTDLDGNSLTAQLVSTTTKGTLVLNADGSFTYTPNAGFYGNDSFAYKVYDGSLSSNVATVAITVNRISTDLAITKVSKGNMLKRNDVFDYEIKVINNGIYDGTGVIARDILPSSLEFVSASATTGTYDFNADNRSLIWNIGNLSVGANQTLQLKVKALRGGWVLNTATVTGNQFDPIPDNNKATDKRLIYGFMIPNVFTPNGDGTNDFFEIEGITEFETELYIYNRWGNEVYKTRNYQNNWGGSDLPSATYYYALKVKNQEGKWESYAGFVEILK
ncbi:Ig-like domain-containing protein, partial [Solitalea sp. MAHUQ-68]